jgi:ABC transporter substrate binding protein
VTRLPRRLVLLAAVPLLLTMKSAASTQRVARVGVLLQSTPTPQGTRWAVRRTFVERLRELGWTEGVNLQLVVLPDPMYLPHLERLFGACLRRGLPAATTGGKAYTEGGALLSYSVNADNLFRQAAEYTDRILRGASPAETPIEQPSRYELIFNLKTARALGFDVPRALRLRADEVIE